MAPAAGAQRRGGGGGLSAGSAANKAAGGGSYATKLTAGTPSSELCELEEQHKRDLEKVDAIRAQLARMLN